MTKTIISGTDVHERSLPDVSRRKALIGGSAALAVSTLAWPAGTSPVMAQASTAGAAMVDRAGRWLELLNEEQRSRALFAFDDPLRQRWNYMLGSAFANGLALETMTDAQKDLALDLFATGLSEAGLETAMNIMLQQDILRDELGKGSPDRNRERFSLIVFGAPSTTEPWGWRWEGHHLTISFTLIGDQVVAHTPKAFSSEPNTVPSGPHRGLVVLPENETLGRAVFSDLSASNRRQALISERSFGNVLAMAGREGRFTEREGVALGDLPQGQIDMVRRLIDVYTTNHLAQEFASVQSDRIAGQDLMSARFGWAGADLDGNSIYYRIHGETFLIEFATLRNQPQHQHTIVHDLERNLGAHVI